jgi:hypothetical protein
MGANVVDHFPDPLEQLRVIQDWFAYPNPVAVKLSRIANQTRSMSQGPHRHWTIGRRHSAKFTRGDQDSLSAQVACAHRSNYAGGAPSDDKHVQHIQNLIDPET